MDMMTYMNSRGNIRVSESFLEGQANEEGRHVAEGLLLVTSQAQHRTVRLQVEDAPAVDDVSVV